MICSSSSIITIEMAGSSAPEASSQSVLAIRRHICPFLFRHHLAVLEEVDAESPAGCFRFVLYDMITVQLWTPQHLLRPRVCLENRPVPKVQKC